MVPSEYFTRSVLPRWTGGDLAQNGLGCIIQTDDVQELIVDLDTETGVRLNSDARHRAICGDRRADFATIGLTDASLGNGRSWSRPGWAGPDHQWLQVHGRHKDQP